MASSIIIDNTALRALAACQERLEEQKEIVAQRDLQIKILQGQVQILEAIAVRQGSLIEALMAEQGPRP